MSETGTQVKQPSAEAMQAAMDIQIALVNLKLRSKSLNITPLAMARIIDAAITPTREKRDPEVRLGFASWANGSFELIVRNNEGDETTLHGKLEEDQLEKVDKILPTCVFVTGSPFFPKE